MSSANRTMSSSSDAGVQYFITVLAFFCIAGWEAMMIRFELWTPRDYLVSPETYLTLVGEHSVQLRGALDEAAEQAATGREEDEHRHRAPPLRRQIFGRRIGSQRDGGDSARVGAIQRTQPNARFRTVYDEQEPPPAGKVVKTKPAGLSIAACRAPNGCCTG